MNNVRPVSATARTSLNLGTACLPVRCWSHRAPAGRSVSVEQLTAAPCEEKPLPPTLTAQSRWESSPQRGKEQAGLSAEGRRRGNNEGNSLGDAEQKRPFDLTNGWHTRLMYWIDRLDKGEGCLSRMTARKTTKLPCLGSCTGFGVERRALGVLVVGTGQ